MNTARTSTAKQARQKGQIDFSASVMGKCRRWAIRRAGAVDFTEADWDAVLDVNLRSVFFLSQAVARSLDRRGTPRPSPCLAGWTGLAAASLNHSVHGDFNLFDEGQVRAAMAADGFEIRR